MRIYVSGHSSAPLNRILTTPKFPAPSYLRIDQKPRMIRLQPKTQKDRCLTLFLLFGINFQFPDLWDRFQGDFNAENPNLGQPYFPDPSPRFPIATNHLHCPMNHPERHNRLARLRQTSCRVRGHVCIGIAQRPLCGPRQRPKLRGV